MKTVSSLNIITFSIISFFSKEAAALNLIFLDLNIKILINVDETFRDRRLKI